MQIIKEHSCWMVQRERQYIWKKTRYNTTHL